MFDPIDPKQSFPALERGILKYWQEEDTFKRSLRSLIALDTESERKKGGKDSFSFYDGPPFATGLPHYGHLLAGTIKDVIPRYQTMQGKHVQRRFGWDCHGLPVEYEVEKEFGLDRDKIKAMGVKAFNDLCRSVVLRYTKEWRTTVERMGRWADMDWDYRTMDPDYMESIWWVFEELYKKGLIYEGHKPMQICPRCVTPLSNFEVTQGYKEVTDQSAVVKFVLEEPKDGKDSKETSNEKTYVLAWTTTPWTLPGNLFLAVNPGVTYVKFRYKNTENPDQNGVYIASQAYFTKKSNEKPKNNQPDNESYELLSELSAQDLIGKKYTPLFPYFTADYPLAFRVVAGDFVTTEDGTGVVHIAPGFGEDDFEVGKREGTKVLQHVTMEGKFIPAVTDFAGQEVKPKDDPTKTDQKIIKKLQEKGLLFEQISYTHTYPHCWRCDTPLLNYATSSWFVSVEKIKQAMLKANAQTEWVPDHIRDGRFGNWLENSRDWAISRSRYWGTPLPLWRHDTTGEIRVLGSRDAVRGICPGRFTKITVVRHGESEGNLIPIYQSEVPGTDLTENGKLQAFKLALILKDKGVQKIYSSPLARTQQTAAVIGKETGIPVEIDDRIREVEFNEYEGKTLDYTDLSFVKERRQHKLETNKIETIYHLPGMENWEDVNRRVQPFLKEIILNNKGEHIVLVTHADIVKNIEYFFTGEEPRKLTEQPFPSYATPYTFYWDHQTGSPFDLHKEVMDSISWHEAEDPTAVQLTVLLHGESDWNGEGRITGASDRELSELGRKQAAGVQSVLKMEDYDVILSSDLQRANETACIVTEGWNKDIIPMALFQEQSFGAYEGKTIQELEAIDPEFARNFRLNLMDMPDGESKAALLDRAKAAILYIKEQYAGKRVLLVTHGRFINALKQVEQGASGYTLYPNCHTETIYLGPKFRRIPDVLDCWFESGSMPYAQAHYPFESTSDSLPPGFPADFIAEGIDQTRGWFYTLTVLSAALFGKPAFEHCIVNGTVLAEDGKKMSKRLKNYPEPLIIVDKHGADAVRFALMQSPAVRAEDMRFSEKLVEETLRNVLLPFWNTYSFFVTYANAAGWEPVPTRKKSDHPLDTWILTEIQDLTNRMTAQLDSYDLSACCNELHETIDRLTNWYIRLSRRRFAGKSALQEDSPGEGEHTEDQQMALSTLYDVLLTVSQLLAPFCPFMTEAVYLNLTGEEHGSVHLTRWPETRQLTADEHVLLHKTRVMRRIVSLGLSIRSDQKVKVRQPLAGSIVALPTDILSRDWLTHADLQLLRDELNVKNLEFVEDPGTLAEAFAQVDARKAGPRFGKKVQELIAAGKRGEFTVKEDGSIDIMGETLLPEEVTVVYRSREGSANVAADHGIVVSMDTTVTPELQLEGLARDIVRGIQKLRKEQGLQMQDQIVLAVTGADDILSGHQALIERETNAIIGTAQGDDHAMELDDRKVTVRFSVR